LRHKEFICNNVFKGNERPFMAKLIPVLCAFAIMAAIQIQGATTTIDAPKKDHPIDGLGGVTAFYAGWITAHPYKQEIFMYAFAGQNRSMVRLGNWYRYPTTLSGFDSAATEIVAKGNRVLGHLIPIYMRWWAPPAFLKNIGQIANGGSLIYTNGGFAYAAFAQYRRDSVRAYQFNSVNLTWASIQNEPDFVASYDSCIIKPKEEGANYASYSEALVIVYNKLTNLPSAQKTARAGSCHDFITDDWLKLICY
jgi:O-glycosyl hydrolase